jgi:D-sedoheptulose 7-phosphate isomerase
MNDVIVRGIIRKARESAELATRFFEAEAEPLARCVADLAQRFESGGRLFAIGNGGSACDAEHVALEFLHPIVEKRRPLTAVALTQSSALITAIGNDDDFSQVFSHQIELLCRRGDALLGISTSGASTNVTRGLQKARDMGLLTIGFTGRDGGSMVDLCDHCFVVPSWSVHRIQEMHTILLHLLWDELHVLQGQDDVL